MQSIRVSLVVTMLSICAIWAQAPSVLGAEQNSPELKQNEADQARVVYYLGIKDYIQRYAQTPASCSEIVEAALVTNEELCDKAFKGAVGVSRLSWQEIDTLKEKFRATTRRWALKVALEAKYPDPSIYRSGVRISAALAVPESTPIKASKKEVKK